MPRPGKSTLRKPPGRCFLVQGELWSVLCWSKRGPSQVRNPSRKRWKCQQRGPKLSGGRGKGRGARHRARRPVAPPLPQTLSPSHRVVRTCTPTTASRKPELHPGSVVSHARLEPQYACPSPAAHACPGLRCGLTAGPRDGEAVRWAQPSNGLKPLHTRSLVFRVSAGLTGPAIPGQTVSALSGVCLFSNPEQRVS